MSRELREALDILEKEKSISKDTLLEAIEQSLTVSYTHLLYLFCYNKVFAMTTPRKLLNTRMEVRAGKRIRLEISIAPIIRIPITIVIAVRTAISTL